MTVRVLGEQLSREDGYTVDYRQTEAFGEALDAHFDAHPDDELVMMDPPSYGHGVFATEPYASSANYVDRMSDYCSTAPTTRRRPRARGPARSTRCTGSSSAGTRTDSGRTTGWA